MLEHLPQLDAFGDLPRGIFDPLLYNLRLVRVSLQQALVKLANGGWAHEYEVSLREYGMYLFGALNVNIEQSNQLLLFELVDLRFLGAVKIRVDLAILNKLIASYLSVKGLVVDEVIVLSIDFTFTGWASGEGNTETKSLTILLEYLIH